MHERIEAQVQIRHARIAGFMYLLLIALFMSGQFLIDRITGTGGFAQRLQNIAAEATLYRVGLVLELLASLFTVSLAYALFVVVRPVNERIARLALYFRLGEAFSGLLMFVPFAVLSLQSNPEYIQLLGMHRLETIVKLANSADFASFNITTLFFAFGSTLFFWLFLQTRYIPRWLSASGVFASLVVVVTSMGDLVLPAHANVIQFGWAPIFIAEIATGIWLLAFGVEIEPRSAPDTGSASDTGTRI